MLIHPPDINLFWINWWVSVHHKSRNPNAAVELLPRWQCLATWAVWTSVRAAHLLQTAEGRRALLEATCSNVELSLVRMETVDGALSRCWSWSWTDGSISAVPPAHSCSPQAEGDALSLGEADILSLFRLWCDHQHSGYKSLKVLITIYTNCWQTSQGWA